MTRTEQARIVAWRLRILKHAENEPRYVAQTCRYFGITRTAFYRWKKRFEQVVVALGGFRPMKLVKAGRNLVANGNNHPKQVDAVLPTSIRPFSKSTL